MPAQQDFPAQTARSVRQRQTVSAHLSTAVPEQAAAAEVAGGVAAAVLQFGVGTSLGAT